MVQLSNTMLFKQALTDNNTETKCIGIPNNSEMPAGSCAVSITETGVNPTWANSCLCKSLC